MRTSSTFCASTWANFWLMSQMSQMFRRCPHCNDPKFGEVVVTAVAGRTREIITVCQQCDHRESRFEDVCR